jgi:O-acetyl-ADP-ribose deacetylase (regulator of RNase III)
MRSPVGLLRRLRSRETEQLDAFAGQRLPMQVCPRGCEYQETARREMLTRTELWGRVALDVGFDFETSNCPRCGAQLVRSCARCEKPILAPASERCQFCGLPHPWAAERRAGTERSGIRLWREGETGANDPALEVYSGSRGSLWALEGDLTQLRVDAVVSNDDVEGRMWAEVARAIRKAAGEEVAQRAQDGKPYALGMSWWTEAGNLSRSIKGIIHVASMNRRGESDIGLICRSLVSAMDLAREKECRSLGVAAIGSGPEAIDLSEWLQAVVATIVGYLGPPQRRSESEQPGLDVVLVLFEPEDFSMSCTAIEEAVRKARSR